MKTLISIFKALFLGALVIGSVSCRVELVSEPTRENSSSMSSADYGDTIQPPAKVTASQGNYRSVTLEWDVVKNATQYQIFSADTPYDTFVQEGETAGTETTFTVENELTGITKYYLIKAVNYYGTVSKGSKIVTATTMDAPIITNITPSSEGTSVSVSWWMGNCTENTYAKNIQFKITAYDSSKIKVPGSETIVEGYIDGKLQDTAIIYNLSPSTDYYFTVEAVKKDSNQKTEKSDYTNAETAHRVNPDKAENLVITQGADKDKIILSWQLPAPVEYRDKKTMVYSIQPVYFTIKRKVADADDSTYQLIESYIGAYGDTGIVFDCSTNSTNKSEKLSVEKDESGTTPLNYSKYTSLSKLTYTDTFDIDKNNIERDKKYTYLIQSYTDQAAESNTSEETSIAIADGWRLPLTTFKLNSVPAVDETGNIITQVAVTFALDFNPFDISYTYVLTEDRTEFNAALADNNERVIYYTNNLSDFNSSLSSVNFDNPADESQQGKYTYKLYILNSTEGEISVVPSEYIEVLKAADEVTVTDDAHAIPKIENFEVKDGYKNKFILTWDEIASTEENPVTYAVSWTSFINGTAQDEESVILQSTDSKASGYYTVSDGKVTYTAPAESGESRQFTLKAIKNGIPDTKTFDAVSKTLGTAKPVMTPAQYKSITVKWDAVQMADTDYVITAKYSDNTNAIAEEPVITTDENGIVTCTIENPVGYDDITMSGLPVSLTVKSINTTTGDYTEAPVTVRTLGPALIGTVADTEKISKNMLNVSWNKIPDATGYIIYRTKYTYDENWTSWIADKFDTYFYNAAGDINTTKGEITNSGSKVSDNRAKIVLQNNKYTLTDYDCEQTDITSSYEMNQSQISWGLPFGYIVIPVNGNQDDFILDENLHVTNGKAGVIYKTPFKDQKTATFGFGFNICAEKSQSVKNQVVTFNLPYLDSIGKKATPDLYRRCVTSTSNTEWKKVTTSAKAGDTKIEYAINEDDRDEAFEYFVSYSDLKPNKSILNYLEKSIENNPKYDYTNVNKEQKNKGYVISVQLAAGFGGKDCSQNDPNYYTEYIDWNSLWDYSKKSISPTSIKLYVYNPDRPIYDENDIKKENPWTELITLNKDYTLDSNAEITAENVVYTKATNTKIFVKPANFTGNNVNGKEMLLTEGPLVVIRDFKHYYKLVFNDDENVSFGDDMSVYAYRNITPAELACCINYIIADCFYRAGIDNASLGHDGNRTVSGANSTKFRYKTVINGLGDYYDKFEWGFDNTDYQHIFKNGHSSIDATLDGNDFTSILKLKSGQTSAVLACDEGTLYRLPENTITISNTLGLPSCNGTYTLVVGKNDGKKTTSWTLEGKMNSVQVLNITNKDDFKKVFPYEFGSKHSSADESVNTSLFTYQSPWWN